jgi:polar amino acid transport system permease protein
VVVGSRCRGNNCPAYSLQIGPLLGYPRFCQRRTRGYCFTNRGVFCFHYRIWTHRRYRPYLQKPVIHFIATLYVEIFRGIPLLVQLIWWYFAAPVVIKSVGSLLHIGALANYQSNAILLAIIGLVVCYGAYMSEIFRAGIESISKGQMEAARSLGMTYMQSMRYVIVPQAIRIVLPPVGNEFIMLMKDTSLVSAVAVADLTRRGREFMAAHFNPIEVWTMVALLYLILTLFSARLINWLENRRRFER